VQTHERNDRLTLMSF